MKSRKRHREIDAQELKRVKTMTEYFCVVSSHFRQQVKWQPPTGKPYMLKKNIIGLITSSQFCSNLAVEVFEDAIEVALMK